MISSPRSQFWLSIMKMSDFARYYFIGRYSSCLQLIKLTLLYLPSYDALNLCFSFCLIYQKIVTQSINYKIIMQKARPQSLEIETDNLRQYLNSLFPEILLPSISKFIDFKLVNDRYLKGTTLTLDSNNQFDSSAISALESEGFIYLHRGFVQLFAKSGQHWHHEIEYKEGFFSLINFKRMGTVSPQKFQLVVKDKSIVSVFPLKASFGLDWLREQSRKNFILAKVFYHNDSGMQIQRRKYKFKEFIQHFEKQVVRRDTRFVSEGTKNQKVIIIGRGEAKIVKEMRIKEEKKVTNCKNMDILFVNEGSAVCCQLLLITSKGTNSIITHHARDISPSLEKDREEQLDNEERRGRKQSKNHSRSKSRLSKISVEEGGYELYDPHMNFSNFTVVAESANLEIYTISIDYLIEHISERLKMNFIKLIEQTYVTMLRRTHQKLIEQVRKEDEKFNQSRQKLNLMTSKLYFSAGFNKDAGQSVSQPFKIRLSEIGASTENLNKLKRQQAKSQQKRKLEQRADIINNRQPKIDFKHKIQILLQQKLNLKQGAKTTELQEKIAIQLADIFRKNNENRTEHLQEQRQLLDKKIQLLSKRGGWLEGWSLLSKQGVTPPPLPIPNQNYLTHSRAELLAYQIKEQYADKIHEANKIKEQFMKIRSECQNCACYDNFQKFSPSRSASTFTRTAYRTADGWGRTSRRNQKQEQPLELVYNQMKFLSERTKQKYNHNMHLLKVRKNRDKLQRRKSAPLIHN